MCIFFFFEFVLFLLLFLFVFYVGRERGWEKSEELVLSCSAVVDLRQIFGGRVQIDVFANSARIVESGLGWRCHDDRWAACGERRVSFMR